MNSVISSTVDFNIESDVAVIRMENLPLNGLSFGLRRDVLARIGEAEADANVKAIVLTGTDKAFSCGADVKEFGTSAVRQQPSLNALINAVEACSKPVVAAISGMALGGGLELAMGCHFRVSTPDAKLGLPEVKLGIMPGAGGTQRLPRLIDLDQALNMITTGNTVKATQLLGTDLVDATADGDVVVAAVAFAREVVSEGRAIRRTCDLRVDAPDAEALLGFARAQVKNQKGTGKAAECAVEAILAACKVGFDIGLQIERRNFEMLMNSPEARALQHAFKAERVSSKVAGRDKVTDVPEIRTVGVVGAGTMGRGISLAFLDAGLTVHLLETQQDALDRAVAYINGELDKSFEKGRLTQEQLAARKFALKPTLEYSSFADVDLAIEAVFEDMSVKRKVMESLDGVLKKDAIIASNTSALNLNDIAKCTTRPQSVIGLHFFSPANIMKLLEVVRGDATSDQVLAASIDLARKIGKIAVVVGVCDGFVGNRMVARYLMAANELLCQGASPQLVDQSLEKFGMAMGVFRMGDLAGLDIGWAGRKRRAAENPGQDFSVVADRLCEQGRFGQKNGKGWYRYEAGERKAIADPEVDAIIAQWRTDRGWTARKITAEEVIEACIFALVNEGARILADGIVGRASDIDVVYLNGYGFPRFRGGPMMYADQVGLPIVVRTLRKIAAQPGVNKDFWTPAPLLVHLAEQGQTFN